MSSLRRGRRFFLGDSFGKKRPKNEKLSTHRKYKRRLEWLRSSLTEFEYIAEEKLASGKIWDRRKIEELLNLARQLNAALPQETKELKVEFDFDKVFSLK